MSRPQFFVIFSAAIFVLERFLPTLTSWPVFIFPVFVIVFLLTGKQDASELVYIAIYALAFDLFSGYQFGLAAVAILTIAFIIYLFKTRFKIEPASPFLVIHVLFFSFAYFAILSTRSSPHFILSQAPVITIETIIVFLIFWPALGRARN